MHENCNKAYRKPGDVSVHCRLVDGQYDYCIHTFQCWQSGRWEVDKAVVCELKKNAGRQNK